MKITPTVRKVIDNWLALDDEMTGGLKHGIKVLIADLEGHIRRIHAKFAQARVVCPEDIDELGREIEDAFEAIGGKE